MNHPQSTLEEIIESERAMLLDAPNRYNQHYKHARAVTIFMTLCVESIELDRADMFGRLFSLMKKHQILSFFSSLRLHRVQAMMNLRQTIEAGVSAAFAIANPETHHFANIDASGTINVHKDLNSKHYKWLANKHSATSDYIKSIKDQINGSMAHANIVSGDITFRMDSDHSTASAPFFDITDDYSVILDLWLTSHLGITLMELFLRVAADVEIAHRPVIEFRKDCRETLMGLRAENSAIIAELRGSERFQNTGQMFAQQGLKPSTKP